MGWFTGLWTRAKEWVMSLLPVQDVYDKMGAKPQVSVNMQTLIESWKAAYQGSPSWLTTNTKTMGFPSIVCWDIAKKAIGELEISASLPTPEGQKAVAEEFSTAFIKKSIRPFIRSQVEYALAMGGIVARPWYDQDAGKARIGWYTASNALPTAWDGKKMTGVILIDQITKNTKGTNTTYTKLESIEPADGISDAQGIIAAGWKIVTKAFKSSISSSLGVEIPLSSGPAQWADITPEVQVIGDVCPFAYMGTPWANNQDINSPQGTSIFRDAMSQLEELDRAYTNLSWEIEAGKAALFIDESLLDSDEDGNVSLNQTERRLYRKVHSGGDSDLLEPYNPNLRVDQLNAALKTQLSVICMNCHLDAGAYIYDAAANAVTATEVRTKQQQTYGTILDIQDNMIIPFVGDLIDTVRAVQILYKSEAIPDTIQIGLDFGDSILVDEGTDRINAQSEVTQGLRSKLSYLMEWRGMTEAQALEEIKRISDETPTQTSFFGGV